MDLMTFPSAALPSGKEHLIEFKRMKASTVPSWVASRLNATHCSVIFLHRERVLGARARASTRLERATDTPPRRLLPSVIPRCMLGRQVYHRSGKDGRRAAATPPEPGRFSPELGPLRRARRARPGPLEQPHHQQPAVLPEQLFPVRAGPPAHSGVSFIILTWPPPKKNPPSHSGHTELVFGFRTSARCLCSRHRVSILTLTHTHTHTRSHTGLDELVEVTSPHLSACLPLLLSLRWEETAALHRLPPWREAVSYRECPEIISQPLLQIRGCKVLPLVYSFKKHVISLQTHTHTVPTQMQCSDTSLYRLVPAGLEPATLRSLLSYYNLQSPEGPVWRI